MVDYLFLIPLSPSTGAMSLRTRLQDLCFDQLQNLRSSYLVWYFGDRDIDRPHFKRIDTPGQTKEERMKEAGDLLTKIPQIARYIVRLDDDDPIRAAAFDAVAKRDFDIAADRHHFFHDLVSGLNSAQKRPWIANTAIHAYQEALTRVKTISGVPTEDGKNYLLACDHSQTWHVHYRGKKGLFLPKTEPLYVRILNPASISAGGAATGFDQKTYFEYLDGFGTWRARWPADMEHLRDRLKEIREELYADAPRYRPKKTRRFGIF